MLISASAFNCRLHSTYILYIVLMQGCADAVINGVSHNLGAVAGGAIVLGLFQVRVVCH